MKRALFKIGRHFQVESWKESEHWRVDVDVDKWESEPEAQNPTAWTFPMVIAEKNKAGTGSGTHITVKGLPVIPQEVVPAEAGERLIGGA